MTDADSLRPHATRRQHQEAIARQRRRRQKRKVARLRRIRTLRTFRSLRFWTRFSIAMVLFLAVAFWAKFAVVYDIPSYAQRGALSNVDVYVTVKPWWFGPPVFDLTTYGVESDLSWIPHPYQILLDQLGKYSAVVENPQFVWVSRH